MLIILTYDCDTNQCHFSFSLENARNKSEETDESKPQRNTPSITMESDKDMESGTISEDEVTNTDEMKRPKSGRVTFALWN